MLGGVTVGCGTYDREVVGSTHGRVSSYRPTTWMDDSLGTDNSCIINTKANSAFHPSGLSTRLSGWS